MMTKTVVIRKRFLISLLVSAFISFLFFFLNHYLGKSNLVRDETLPPEAYQYQTYQYSPNYVGYQRSAFLGTCNHNHFYNSSLPLYAEEKQMDENKLSDGIKDSLDGHIFSAVIIASAITCLIYFSNRVKFKLA